MYVTYEEIRNNRKRQNAENPAVVIQVSEADSVKALETFKQAGIKAHTICKPVQERRILYATTTKHTNLKSIRYATFGLKPRTCSTAAKAESNRKPRDFTTTNFNASNKNFLHISRVLWRNTA